MGLTLIERIPKKGWFTWNEGTKIYEYECDVCHKKERHTTIYYNYGFGSSGVPYPPECFGMKVLKYGKINVRRLIVCIDHKDSEIDPIIKERI